MGQRLSNSYEDWRNPKISPRCDRPATFDPHYGFPKGRKQREIKTTWEEMELLSIPIMYRDYCIDYFVPLYKCQRAKAPFAGYYCCDLREAWEHCHYEDYMLRMKEYEREKRLLKRKLRKEMLAAVGE